MMQSLFILRIWQFQIEYDRDYGIDRRRGWSVKWDGSVCTQFAPNPIAAVWRAWPIMRAIVKYRRECEAQ